MIALILGIIALVQSRKAGVPNNFAVASIVISSVLIATGLDRVDSCGGLRRHSLTPTVIFVHGAFADASGFAGTFRDSRTRGWRQSPRPNPLRGVAVDAGVVEAVAAAVEGPVVLVGHSYGGAVISQASADLQNIVGLVYLAGFAPAVGESRATVQEPFTPSLLATTIRPTPYDAVGAVGGPGC